MSKKMPKGLVALSATAIASIYLAGVMSTRGAADGIVAAANEPASATAQPSAEATSAPTVVVGASAPAVPSAASPTATAAPVPTSTPVATASSAYADGTYSGTGTSRFGNVTVSVTTSGGKIINVQITKVTTSFPMSRIAALPAQVISAQSANVNTVTGATYSSQAFKQAVQQALTQAAAANSSAATG